MELYTTQFDGTRTLNKKTVAIISAIGLGVVAVIAVVIILIVRSRTSGFSPQELAQVENQVASETANCVKAPDPEGCKAEKIRQAAASTGAAAVCDMIDGPGKDDCIWAVARENNDASICKGISDSGKESTCSDSIWIMAARSANDVGICKNISDDTQESECESSVRQQIAVVSGCAAAGLDQGYCDARILLQAAMTAKDPDLCAQIQDPSVLAECEDGIGVGDPDFDGLDSAKEAVYGTDPRNPDTDGDGFPDGTEVAGGYNPLGTGTLE